MNTPLYVITNRINLYKYSANPVSCILEINFTGIRSPQQFSQIRTEFVNLLNSPVVIHGESIRIRWDETNPGSCHFTTNDGFLDWVKAQFVENINRICNNNWLNQHVSVTCMLSKPLTYTTTVAAAAIGHHPVN